jgi:hypothetical protein
MKSNSPEQKLSIQAKFEVFTIALKISGGRTAVQFFFIG